MPPTPIRIGAAEIDFSARHPVTTNVVASPALAAETIIASLTFADFGNSTVVQGIQLTGWAAYTVGTSGTAATLRIRQTNVSGTVVASSGALSKTAASLYADDVNGNDATPGVGLYVLTLQVTSGAAASTVSAVMLSAIVV